MVSAKRRWTRQASFLLMTNPDRRTYVELADAYHLPVHEFLRRWNSYEITELIALHLIRADEAKHNK